MRTLKPHMESSDFSGKSVKNIEKHNIVIELGRCLHYIYSELFFSARCLLAGRAWVWMIPAMLLVMHSHTLYAEEKITNLQGDQLEIRTVSARIWIEIEARKDVKIQLLGDTEAIQTIHMDMEGGKVVLKEVNESSGTSVGLSSNTLSSNTTSSNVRINGNVVVHGNSKVSIGTITVPQGQHKTSSPVEIHISLPQSLPLTLNSTGSNITVGKTDAPFKLIHLGSDNVQIAALRDGDIVLQGTGNIQIGNVTGNLKVRSIGTGNLTVQSGEIGKLSIDLKGTGNIIVNGSTVEAAIRLSGTGDITVLSSQHPVIEQKTGVGSIKIGDIQY